jgi:lipopolysaccharide export system permease protein
MNLLERYIAKTVLASMGLVILLLVGLQIFILLVDQSSDFNKGDYGLLQAVFFVLLQMPYQVYLFFPMASLLGCLIGLGVLANHSELVVMRAAGMSIGQITWAILKLALIVILVVTIIGEFFVPALSRYANDKKMMQISQGQSLRTSRGFWLRQGLDFIHITEVLPNYELQNVHQFRFDKDHNLSLARTIHNIKYENNHWVAFDIAETKFHPKHTEAQTIPSMQWDVPLALQMVKVSTLEPDEMSLPALYKYVIFQNKNHHNMQNFALAFWQRLAQPFNTMVMMILAIPFLFGPLRSSTMGAKILAGTAAGFAFYIVNKFVGPVSFVYQWPPFIAGVGPTVLFAVLGIYLMVKVR